MVLTRKELLEREYAPQTTVTTDTTVKTTDLKTIVTTVTTGTSKVDRALERTADLMSRPDLKAWYAKQAYRLGVDRYLGLASDARRGRSPARLFSYLLNNT